MPARTQSSRPNCKRPTSSSPDRPRSRNGATRHRRRPKPAPRYLAQRLFNAAHTCGVPLGQPTELVAHDRAGAKTKKTLSAMRLAFANEHYKGVHGSQQTRRLGDRTF